MMNKNETSEEEDKEEEEEEVLFENLWYSSGMSLHFLLTGSGTQYDVADGRRKHSELGYSILWAEVLPVVVLIGEELDRL